MLEIAEEERDNAIERARENAKVRVTIEKQTTTMTLNEAKRRVKIIDDELREIKNKEIDYAKEAEEIMAKGQDAVLKVLEDHLGSWKEMGRLQGAAYREELVKQIDLAYKRLEDLQKDVESYTGFTGGGSSGGSRTPKYGTTDATIYYDDGQVVKTKVIDGVTQGLDKSRSGYVLVGDTKFDIKTGQILNLAMVDCLRIIVF